MAITAKFVTTNGTKVWQVSPSYVLDFDGFSTSYELNAESNTSVEGSPLTNQRGMKKKQVSFSSNLVAALGIDVRKEFESWETWIGQTGILIIGEAAFGTTWLLTSVKPSNVNIDNMGRFVSMKLTYSFEEGEAKKYGGLAQYLFNDKSAVCITATTEQKATKKPTNKAIENAPKEAAPSKEIGLGDIVQFKGGPHYSNSNAKTYKTSPKPGRAKVTAMAKSAKHPYHVIHVDKSSTVYGWVDASQISK